MNDTVRRPRIKNLLKIKKQEYKYRNDNMLTFMLH